MAKVKLSEAAKKPVKQPKAKSEKEKVSEKVNEMVETYRHNKPVTINISKTNLVTMSFSGNKIKGRLTDDGIAKLKKFLTDHGVDVSSSVVKLKNATKTK